MRSERLSLKTDRHARKPGLGDLIAAHAARTPASCAIRTSAEAISFADLFRHVRRYAAALQAVDPTDRPVAIRLANGVDHVVAQLAALEAGRPSVPIDPSLPADEAELLLAASGASSVIEERGMRTLDTPPIAVAPGIAMIAHSAGVGGVPKLVGLTHSEIVATIFAMIARLGIGRDVRHLAALPSGVLVETVLGMFTTLVAGGTYLAGPDMVPGGTGCVASEARSLAARVERLEATSLLLSPNLLRDLIIELETSGRRLPSLRTGLVTGGEVSASWRDRAARLGLFVTGVYGMAEAGSAVAVEAPEDPVRGTFGRALGHVRIGLRADGEIVVHANDPLGLQDRRTIPTGDLGTLDEAGRLVVTGRRANLLATRSGRSVAAERIELALLDQSEIAEAVVFTDDLGALRAIVVPRSDGSGVAAAIARANASLLPDARISAWESSCRFTVTDGTLTADGRPRRSAIIDRWRETRRLGRGLGEARRCMPDRA